jgi:hypothetical protein
MMIDLARLLLLPGFIRACPSCHEPPRLHAIPTVLATDNAIITPAYFHRKTAAGVTQRALRRYQVVPQSTRPL